MRPLAFLLAAMPAVAAFAENPATRPNILVILTDDIGWGDYGCYNPQSKIPSPNIDRLARDGMRFTHAHTPAGLCAPTRYAMLTGNYPWRGRSPGGTWGFNVPSQLKPGQQTVAKLLQTAGYRTAMFGKAGTGGFYAFSADKTPRETLAPQEWGFDYSFLIPRGHQATPLAFFENGVAVGKLNGDGIDARAADWDHRKVGERLLEKALGFLDDHHARNKAEAKSHPFYLHFCTDGAHGPYVPAETLAGRPLKGVTKMTEHTDMVHETDILAGKLVEALEKRGLLAETLVVITSDNGGIPSERGLGHDAVAGLRGKKSFIFEGGHRVPLVAFWQGKVPGGTVRHQVVGTHDIVATALELAGVPIPHDQALDSVSLAPILLGRCDDSQPVRESLLVQSSPGRDAFDDGGFRAGGPAPEDGGPAQPAAKIERKAEKRKAARNKGSDGIAHAIYRGDWKLVFDGRDKAAALYDLSTDLAEERNLIGEPVHADRVQDMIRLFQAIRSSRRSTPTTPPGR